MNTNLYQMDVEVKKSRGLMETDLHDYHNQHQNSNLMRYRSAPGSLLASLVSGGCEDLLNDRSSSPEESMFARFISCNGRAEPESPDLHEATTESADGYSNASQRMYQTPSLNRFPNHSSVNSGTPTESSFKSINSVATELKTSRGNYSNLGRQNSSPPELLSSLTVENGFAAIRDTRHFKPANCINGGNNSPISRLKNCVNFSSGLSSGLRILPQIDEIVNDCTGPTTPVSGSMGNGIGGNRSYIPSLPTGSWNESAFNGLKRFRDDDQMMLSGLTAGETKKRDSDKRTTSLVHQLSLPKTTTEMAAIEQYLKFQDSVPCKIRAKRGFATHPRSIAERVRRTRISERMRKLQELFPNLDKQTSTADMLDLAVEYIKDLQKQVKTLMDCRAKCTCLSTQKQYSTPAVQK